MRERGWGLSSFLAVVLISGGVVWAQSTPIEVPLKSRKVDTGWSIFMDPAYQSQVGIHVRGLRDGTTVVLQLDKWFSGPRPVNGYAPIILQFTKNNPSTTYNRFVIDSEYIVNNTATTWQDYHMELSPGVVGFDPNSVPGTNNTFQTVEFVDDYPGYLGLPTQIDFYNGTIPNTTPNNVFQPGYWSGDVTIVANPAMGTGLITNSFILSEYPTPEPTALLLLAIGGLWSWIKRK